MITDIISTLPMIIATIMSHLYPNPIETVVTPIENPFVVKAEPTSNNASMKDTPMVWKITAKMTNVKIKSTIATRADRYS